MKAFRDDGGKFYRPSVDEVNNSIGNRVFVLSRPVKNIAGPVSLRPKVIWATTRRCQIIRLTSYHLRWPSYCAWQRVTFHSLHTQIERAALEEDGLLLLLMWTGPCRIVQLPSSFHLQPVETTHLFLNCSKTDREPRSTTAEIGRYKHFCSTKYIYRAPLAQW